MKTFEFFLPANVNANLFQRFWLKSTFGFLIFLLIFSSSLFAQKPLLLQNDKTVYLLDSTHFDLVDSIANEKFIYSSDQSNKGRLFFFNPDVEKSNWYKFSITNDDSISKEWLLVSYNYSINEIDLIVNSEKEHNHKFYFRDTTSIYKRNIQHKQPVFTLHFQPFETKTFFMRIKNDSSYEYVFALYSEAEFFSHFFKEYLFFGLFYGLMLFVFLYSIVYYIFLKDKVTLAYALFIASQIMYMLYRDGNGLFLIPYLTEYADMLKNIFRTGLCVFILVYTAYFLKVDSQSKIFKVFLICIVLRIIYTFFMLDDSTGFTFLLELLFIAFCTGYSIYSYIKGFGDAKYMSIGLSILTISYFIYYLTVVGVANSGFGFFLLYYGISLESIFMTMALTERVKRMRLENFRKEQMNKELEELVVKRTQLIDQQSQELSLFLYSASHDLKGPLKTIRGICSIAMMDKNTDHGLMYSHIENKVGKLEAHINDLNSVTRIKNGSSSEQEINFQILHNEMLEAFSELPGFNEMKFEFKEDIKNIFLADYFSIKCIYQNIFENAIKYRDKSKDSILQISVLEQADMLHIIFQDNGQGIGKEKLPKVFNMFYRGNEASKEDTGLGLYIVKLALEKLDGIIQVESEIGIGTKFSIQIPRK